MKSAWKDEPIVVLDACALIAFLNDEPGADVIALVLEEVPAVEMAAINLLEIAYDTVRRTGQPSSATDVIDAVRQLPILIRWDIDQEIVEAAACFKTRFRISLADSVALALAATRNAPLATSDHHEFDSIGTAGEARFLWIR
ncbi:MAG: PIN domain-containing protein [Verrucomicrobiota bacterium]